MSTSLSNLVDNFSEILKKNANRAWKEKKIDQNVILSGLKIIDSITDAKNVEKKCSKLINEAIKIFPTASILQRQP